MSCYNPNPNCKCRQCNGTTSNTRKERLANNYARKSQNEYGSDYTDVYAAYKAGYKAALKKMKLKKG